MRIPFKVGPSFFSELQAAGLTDGIMWDNDGVSVSEDYPQDLLSLLEVVIAAHDPTKPAPVPHATECSPAQGEIALYQAGHYAAYLTAVSNSAYVPLKIYVQKATKWELSNPYIQAMQAELGLSDDEVQALFDLAVTL